MPRLCSPDSGEYDERENAAAKILILGRGFTTANAITLTMLRAGSQATIDSTTMSCSPVQQTWGGLRE